jgi:tRNA (guanine37-N1)-methyltransferase
MKFDVLTLFPETIEKGVNYSIIKKAIDNNLIEINAIDIRNYSNNKHKSVDDYPFGGGPGMVMSPQPLWDCITHIRENNNKCKIIYMSPQGKVLNQALAIELSKQQHLVLLCGHYEGIDQRVIDNLVDMELSIGDYVITGGELASLVVIDSVARLVPGVLSSEQSYSNESFYQNRLEHPQYTRPRSFNGYEVPEVLISGNHHNIEQWRVEQSLNNTLIKRPDLLEKYPPNDLEEKILEKLTKKQNNP